MGPSLKSKCLGFVDTELGLWHFLVSNASSWPASPTRGAAGKSAAKIAAKFFLTGRELW